MIHTPRVFVCVCVRCRLTLPFFLICCVCMWSLNERILCIHVGVVCGKRKSGKLITGLSNIRCFPLFCQSFPLCLLFPPAISTISILFSLLFGSSRHRLYFSMFDAVRCIHHLFYEFIPARYERQANKHVCSFRTYLFFQFVSIRWLVDGWKAIRCVLNGFDSHSQFPFLAKWH